MSDSAPYRIWKRFQNAHAAIRTALYRICPSPECSRTEPDSNVNQHLPADSALAHLVQAFTRHELTSELGPIAAFQVALQTFFI